MSRIDHAVFGTPCWIDLSTSDIGRATAFYGELFGWEATDTGEDYGHYTNMTKDDALVAALSPKLDPTQPSPDMWNIYFAVPDVHDAAASVRKAGGQLLFEPMPIADAGAMTMFTDSAGAAVGLWQPGTHQGFGLYQEPGAPCWFELQTRNMAGAGAFYRDIFGMEVMLSSSPGGPPYSMLKKDGVERAGIFDMTEIVPEEVPAYWTVYFGVADLGDALRYVEDKGGTIITPTMEVGGRPWATVADPMGAPFVLMQV